MTIEAITRGTISIFSRLMNSVPRKSNSDNDLEVADMRLGPGEPPGERAERHRDQDGRHRHRG